MYIPVLCYKIIRHEGDGVINFCIYTAKSFLDCGALFSDFYCKCFLKVIFTRVLTPEIAIASLGGPEIM